MAFEMKPLSCNLPKLRELSEKLIVSHYENNYGGETVERDHRPA
jgi:Fe-Mn family superoxide dismutase